MDISICLLLLLSTNVWTYKIITKLLQRAWSAGKVSTRHIGRKKQGRYGGPINSMKLSADQNLEKHLQYYYIQSLMVQDC